MIVDKRQLAHSCLAEDGGGEWYWFGWDSMNSLLGWTIGQNHAHIASRKGGSFIPGGRVYSSFRKENLCGA
eukprot:9381434-Pyramimonas_sp.AAC.1